MWTCGDQITRLARLKNVVIVKMDHQPKYTAVLSLYA